MFEHHKKESPILSLAGIGGGPASYLFYEAAGGGGGAALSRSLRFAADAGTNDYLSKSFSSAGTQTTWSFACWFKITKPGTDFQVTPLFSGSSPWGGISIYQDKLRFAAYSGSSYIVHLHTTQLLRDPNAWYHLVAVFDSTNGTSGDRARLYLNGKRITAFSTETYPSPNATTTINSTTEQRIGHEVSNNVYSNCYLADIYFLDGVAVTDTNGTVNSFGEFDSYGVWNPKAYSGSYGSNGYHLTFNSYSSASDLGTDTSGQSNNFTVTGHSVAAGANNDSVLDSPTLTSVESGNPGGNYCTLSPIDKNNTTLTNGNLKAVISSNSCCRGTFFPESGKWYFEYKITSVGNPYAGIGASGKLTNYSSENSVVVPNNGLVTQRIDGTQIQPGYATSHNAVATYMVAMDLDNHKIWWGRAGQWHQYHTTTADTTTTKAAIEAGNGAYTFDSPKSGWTVQLGTSSNASTYEFNAGQRAFEYANQIPDGYKALCTVGLSTSAVGAGSTQIDIITRAGGGTTQTLAFGPDIVWTDRMNSTSDSYLFDRVRGNDNYIRPNGTNTNGSSSGACTFNSNGYSIGSGFDWGDDGNGPNDVIEWVWNAGETTSTIGAGSALNSSVYNQDRKWSDGVANSNSDFDQAKTNAFNGNRANKLRTGGNSVLVTINFSPALTVNDYIEIHGEDYSTANVRYTATINGITHTKDEDGGGVCKFFMGGSLTQITVDNNSGSGRTYLEYIKVDGRELVDNDQTPPDATTLSAQVRANPDAGISVIRASAVSSTDQINRIAHGLGKEPEFIFTKNLEQTDEWFTYHKDLVNNNNGANTKRQYARFNHNGSGTITSSSLLWQHSNATLGFNGALWVPGGASDDIMFYAFRSIPGYSKFGFYRGNGSTDGVVVNLGFRPRLVIVKRADSGTSASWRMMDSERDPYNPAAHQMFVSDQDGNTESSNYHMDMLSNGFKWRNSFQGNNADNSRYIFAAWAENPFRSSRAR
tara:strand:+ start:569 stop:3520 length:2952 start_codon:yes stop_codon:yes gene_type:complete